jgi:hypothetical protein
MESFFLYQQKLYQIWVIIVPGIQNNIKVDFAQDTFCRNYGMTL